MSTCKHKYDSSVYIIQKQLKQLKIRLKTIIQYNLFIYMLLKKTKTFLPRFNNSINSLQWNGLIYLQFIGQYLCWLYNAMRTPESSTGPQYPNIWSELHNGSIVYKSHILLKRQTLYFHIVSALLVASHCKHSTFLHHLHHQYLWPQSPLLLD